MKTTTKKKPRVMMTKKMTNISSSSTKNNTSVLWTPPLTPPKNSSITKIRGNWRKHRWVRIWLEMGLWGCSRSRVFLMRGLTQYQIYWTQAPTTSPATPTNAPEPRAHWGKIQQRGWEIRWVGLLGLQLLDRNSITLIPIRWCWCSS